MYEDAQTKRRTRKKDTAKNTYITSPPKLATKTVNNYLRGTDSKEMDKPLTNKNANKMNNHDIYMRSIDFSLFGEVRNNTSLGNVVAQAFTKALGFECTYNNIDSGIYFNSDTNNDFHLSMHNPFYEGNKKGFAGLIHTKQSAKYSYNIHEPAARFDLRIVQGRLSLMYVHNVTRKRNGYRHPSLSQVKQRYSRISGVIITNVFKFHPELMKSTNYFRGGGYSESEYIILQIRIEDYDDNKINVINVNYTMKNNYVNVIYIDDYGKELYYNTLNGSVQYVIKMSIQMLLLSLQLWTTLYNTPSNAISTI
jgi:hypothetical protein